MKVEYKSPIATAWIENYGYVPEGREQNANYSAFEVGFRAGVRYGIQQERKRIRNFLGEEPA